MACSDGRVELVPFADAEEAITLIAERYANLTARDPDLSQNVTPAACDDVRAWHAAGKCAPYERRTKWSACWP